MWFGKSKKARLEVKGMSCSHCEATVEKGLAGLAGVMKVKADHAADVVTVHYKEDLPSLEEVKAKVAELGYEAGNAWT